uniref:Uncharacterized protein n=1 Tax=Romanomermis culicivorax TaxID=13658 RepID=A0A915HUT5_ROMCU
MINIEEEGCNIQRTRNYCHTYLNPGEPLNIPWNLLASHQSHLRNTISVGPDIDYNMSQL